MSYRDNAESECVKSNKAPAANPITARADEKAVTPSNIPFFSDYFALARLLADYKNSREQGPEYQRMNWNCHILSGPSFAFAFHDLEQRLFGETTSFNLYSPLDFANDFKATYGRMLCDNFGELWSLVAPRSIRSKIGKLLGIYLSTNLYIKHDKNPQKDKYNFIVSLITKIKDELTRDKDTGEYSDLAIRELIHKLSNFYMLVEKTPYKSNNGDIFYLGTEIYKAMPSLLDAMREQAYSAAIDKLLALPFGATILWHVGLAPKPHNPNYVGLRFGFLTVESMTSVTRAEGKSKAIRRRQAVNARCDCGSPIKVALVDLLAGRAISCGKCGRPKTLTGPTVKKWALATLDNIRRNKDARAKRRPYKFTSPEECLFYVGLRYPDYTVTTRAKQSKVTYDLGRIDDRINPDVVYGPGSVCWELTSENRAVETKKLLSSGQLNQQVMIENLPDYSPKKPVLESLGLYSINGETVEIDDLL